MKIEETLLTNVKLIKPKVYGDQRGHFLEAYRQDLFKKYGIELEFVQDNISTSKKNTLRGLHYQLPPASQAKLIMVVHGKILDVAVDLRQNSPTFGESFSTELSSENRHMLLVPTGFAHGFSVLSDEATIYYKCNDYYNKELERGVRWDDPQLNIDWKVDDPILSEKDKQQPLLKELDSKDLF
ncbi:MAG: dTDP-4-dehydrorhamnose 3,5-epimerase [Balneolaceae bacterium]